MRNQERQVPDEIQPPPVHNSALDPADVDAVILDMDGVITDTASVHKAAWKSLFDAFLEERAERTGAPFQPFRDEDYLTYVDGKAREDGVASFLASRGIDLPRGSPDDPPEAETVFGLGHRKGLEIAKDATVLHKSNGRDNHHEADNEDHHVPAERRHVQALALVGVEGP
jgi:hypothetical protein